MIEPIIALNRKKRTGKLVERQYTSKASELETYYTPAVPPLPAYCLTCFLTQHYCLCVYIFLFTFVRFFVFRGEYWCFACSAFRFSTFIIFPNLLNMNVIRVIFFPLLISNSLPFLVGLLVEQSQSRAHPCRSKYKHSLGIIFLFQIFTICTVSEQQESHQPTVARRSMSRWMVGCFSPTTWNGEGWGKTILAEATRRIFNLSRSLLHRLTLSYIAARDLIFVARFGMLFGTERISSM